MSVSFDCHPFCSSFLPFFYLVDRRSVRTLHTYKHNMYLSLQSVFAGHSTNQNVSFTVSSNHILFLTEEYSYYDLPYVDSPNHIVFLTEEYFHYYLPHAICCAHVLHVLRLSSQETLFIVISRNPLLIRSECMENHLLKLLRSRLSDSQCH